MLLGGGTNFGSLLNPKTITAMQKFITATALASLATFGTMQISSAHVFNGGDTFVDHPVIQKAHPSARVLRGYVTLQNNNCTKDDRLLAIEGPAAEKVEVRQAVAPNSKTWRGDVTFKIDERGTDAVPGHGDHGQ